jgi:hypothetical protein
MNRTLVEMYIHNPTENDSLEFVQQFQLNNSSIVENLWMEIGGNLKKGITLKRNVATHVYKRIVRKNIDPAYLIKISGGRYLLRVFPIDKHQTKKVVFEYYSILGIKKGFRKLSTTRKRRSKRAKKSTNKKNELVWFIDFKTDYKFKKSISFSSVQPINTILNLSSISSTLTLTQHYNTKTIEQKFRCGNVDKFYLGMNHSQTNTTTKYYDDSTICFSNNLLFKEKEKYKQSEIFNITKNYPPTIIKNIILNSIQSLNDTLYYNNREYVGNPFFIEMLDYLANKKQRKLNYHLIGYSDIGYGNYSNIGDNLILIENILFSTNLKPNDDVKVTEIKCPFVNKYFDYHKGLYRDYEYKINSDFLTYRLAKIVIEDDSLRNRILENTLKAEKIGALSLPPPPQRIVEEAEPVFFIAVEKLPTLADGYKSLQNQIYYPSKKVDSIMSEKIYTSAKVNNAGEVISTIVRKGNNKLLKQISRLILSQANWMPARQRGKPVTVAITIPLSFDNDSLSTYQERAKNVNYQIGGRVYRPMVKNNSLILLDNEFDYSNISTISIKSDKFYELMYNFPNLMDVIYQSFYLSNISELGLVILSNKTKKNILITNY